MFGKCERCKDEKSGAQEVTIMRSLPAILCAPCRRDLDLYLLDNPVSERVAIIEMKLEAAVRSADYTLIESHTTNLYESRRSLVPQIMNWLSRVPLQKEKEPNE